MTAHRKLSLPEHLRLEMARLHRRGFPLLPLGRGADGKSPLVEVWIGPALPLARVLAPLHRSGAQVYGIRLDGLVVIDCDDDDPALVAAMEARFGPSPVHVKTPRGWHLYYRADLHCRPTNLHAEGLPVDIKTGARNYAVGPMSFRPDGGAYVAAKGALGIDALPTLRAPLRPAPEAPGAETLVGHRHERLVKEAVAMVEFVDSAEELAANLAAVRDDLCQDAENLPDSEVAAIAGWAWKVRLENRVYRGRHSAFSVQRLALDALRRWENGTDALALYVMLVDQHGHIPGKRFALDFKAMRESDLTRLSIPRLRAARRTLQAVGLLRLMSNHRAGAVHQTFALGRPVTDGEGVAGVTPMKSAKGARGSGGGLRLHMTPEIEPTKRVFAAGVRT